MARYFKDSNLLQMFFVKNLSLIIIIFPILVLFFYGGAVSLFISYKQNNHIKNEINKLENKILEEQKKLLRDKAKNIKSFIEFSIKKQEELANKELESIVNMAIDISLNIIKKNDYILTISELQELILFSLEEIRFNSNRGYIFINTLYGRNVMHPFNKNLKNKKIRTLKDGEGKLFVKEFEKIIRKKKSGFVKYSWYKPNAGFQRHYPKISYIKKFKYYNWYFGGGEYLDNIKSNIKKDILIFLESIKMYESGFIFIFNKKGKLVKHPCAEKFVNLNDEEVKSENMEILQKFKKASLDKKFVYYEGKDCLTNSFMNKISYIYHVKKFDWYIVISKNLQDIEETLKAEKKILIDKLDNESTLNIELLLVISFISLILSYYLSFLINKTLNMYEKELDENQKTMLYQARLAQSGELLNMIAHQWRQPLGKIAVVASSIRIAIFAGKLEENELDKKLEKIENYTEHLSQTIDDFKNFYKPKKEKEKTFIYPLVERSIDFVESSIKHKNIQIIRDFIEDSEIEIFSNELVQVVTNLIQNAIDASQNRGWVKIKINCQNNQKIIEISDNAGGIKLDNIQQVFELYFSTKDSSHNLGLGLYMSKIIIEKHLNSSIEVKNSDDGAIFTIRLKK